MLMFMLKFFCVFIYRDREGESIILYKEVPSEPYVSHTN